jgi:hypothetical protein
MQPPTPARHAYHTVQVPKLGNNNVVPFEWGYISTLVLYIPTPSQPHRLLYAQQVVYSVVCHNIFSTSQTLMQYVFARASGQLLSTLLTIPAHIIEG